MRMAFTRLGKPRGTPVHTRWARLSPVPVAVFRQLDLSQLAFTSSSFFTFTIAIDVRVAADQLVADAVEHVGDVKAPCSWPILA
jgi:hypothetical protein